MNIDFRLIDIFKIMVNQNKKIEDMIAEEFYRIKEDLNKVPTRPTRLELFTYMDNDIYANMKSRAALNILNDYLAFLDKRGELSNEERKLLITDAHKFIKKLESVSMSQTYKVPLLLAFY